MGLYSDLKTISVPLSSVTKSAAFRIPGELTVMAIETDGAWSTADVTFEASSQEFDGSTTFSLDDARFKGCENADGTPVECLDVLASKFRNVGATLTGHYFKLVSSASQTSTVLVHYRHIA